MKLSQLKALIKHGESEVLEFKNSTASLSSGMQTICAFLNSEHGGIVIFGVKDNSDLVGQDVTDKTQKDIALEINKIEPHARIIVTYVLIEKGKQLIILSAKSDDKAPYTYDGRGFVRNQSTTRRMTKEEYVYLYNENNPTVWENLTSNDCTIKDLDKNRIKKVINTAIAEKRLVELARDESIPNILKKLDLMVNDKLTNAAVILFCKDEDKQFMRSKIQLARFKGTDKREFLNTKEYTSNAFDLYEKAMDYLHFVLPVAARIEPGKAERIETPAIPYNALREAIINALIHRDYSHPGGSISIAIYDDRVEIANTGFLPNGVELNELTKKHHSVLRNPLIAHVFYLCKMIERWGRGTLDMIEDCKKVGNPIPQFEEIGGGFLVTFPLKEPMPTIIYKEEKKELILTERQKEILSLLQKRVLTRNEIMKQMKESLSDRTLQLELTKLKKLGLAKSERKTKLTVWLLT
jgi:ATP-dependent DNA helicase RecG